jgi:hypothetical protein
MATRQAVNNTRAITPVSVPEITRIQVEGNDTVSFLYGVTPPYQWVRGMSQIMDQNPAYISYRYDTITISQVAGESFTFTTYSITDVGGNTFTALTSFDTSDVVARKTQEVYRLLVTAIFKGCCECGNTEPECSIQYTSGNGVDPGTLLIDGSDTRINYFTANNQDFTGFWPIIQDGSWIFIFSKTDPTVYGVFQLSSYFDGGTFAQFSITLLAGTDTFPEGTELCVDVTSVGGSLVQGWQDTLIVDSVLTQDNTVDGGNFDFVFNNNNSFTVNSPGGSLEINSGGSSLVSGSQSITVNASYIDIITPDYASASTGWVLALDALGHVEYVEAGTGTISSIGLFMPPAFTVSTPNPLTSNGSFTVTGAGTDLQYIDGTGNLQTFPTYTVENGLHAFGGVPGEAPADPFLFHLGGLLIEDTVITATNGLTEYVLGVAGTVNQDTRQPLAVSNLGLGGTAVFADYGAGFRPNPTVQMLTDNDLYQPILELTMQGNLPNLAPVLANRISLLRLKYDGAPANARTAMDFSFRNNDPNPNLDLFPAVQLTAEVTNFTVNNETANLELMIFQGGSQQVKLIMEGKGQLWLNEYGADVFSDGSDNRNNALTYVLSVDNLGRVWKKLATGGGTVTSVGATGLLTTTATNPFTTSGVVTSEMASGFLVGRYSPGTGVFQQITIGDGLTLTGDTLSADGGGATYDGDQGVYKDTALVNDTFMLGAPIGFGSTISFQVDREIDVDDKKFFINGAEPGYGAEGMVNIIGNGSGLGGSLLNIDGSTSAGIQINTPSNFGYEIYQGFGSYIENKSDTEQDVLYLSRTTVSSAPGFDKKTSLTFYIPNPANGSIPKIAGHITARSEPEGAAVLHATNIVTEAYDFVGNRIDITTLYGQNGLVQFNFYGDGTFYDASPVWALGVDGSGNIVEIDPGGGGGTYTVNNGLSPQTLPSPDPNNFQLGGLLIQDTTIVGASNTYNMVFDEMKNFTVNSSNASKIILKNFDLADPARFSELYAAEGSSYIQHVEPDGSAATVVCQAASADIGFSGPSGIGTGLKAEVAQILLSYSDPILAPDAYTIGIDVDGIKTFTPAVLAGTATVGQVLTLQNATTGEVEFQNAGLGATYDGNEGVYKNTALANDTFQLGYLTLADSILAGNQFSVDRFVDTGVSVFNVNGTPNASNGVIRVVNKSSSASNTFGVYASNDSTVSRTSGAIFGQGGSAGIGVIGTTNNVLATSTTRAFGGSFGSLNADTDATRLLRSPLNVFATRLGGGVVDHGAQILYTLNNDVAASFDAGGVGFLSTSVTSAADAETSKFFVSTKESGIALPTNKLEIDTLGQARLNEYGQTPAKFPDASPVWALGVDSTGKMVEFTPSGGGGLKSGIATQVSPGVYEATITGVTALAAGDTFMIQFDSANQGASTLEINTLSAFDIFKNTDVKISSGDIKTDQEITIVYDGTAFQAIGLVTNQLLAYVHNSEATAITKGQVVYAFGASGDRMSVKLAMADADATSAKTIGMVYDSSIASGGEGYIIIQGVIEGINTAAFAAGDTLYLSGSTPGGYVSTPTYAPVHRVYVGIVEKANAGNGQIYVRCQNGYELDEIHDVDLITTPPVNNDVLVFDTSTTPDLWVAKSIPTILGATTVGLELVTLPNPSAVRYIRINADNTVDAITAATLKSELLATTPYGVVAYGTAFVATVLAGTTTYGVVTSGTLAFNTNFNNREFTIPFGGTVKNLYLHTSNQQGAGGSLEVSVAKNGVNTALSISVPALGLSGVRSNTTDTFTAVAGDKLVFRLQNNHTNVSAVVVSVSFIIEQL